MKKLTVPVLPFKRKAKVSREAVLERIRQQKPSREINSYVNTSWFRQHCTKSLGASLNSMLPNNGIPVIPEEETEEEKNKREIKQFLSTYCKPIDKFNKMTINPKYLYDPVTFEKVKKLRDIFLEFDEDGSRKMEIDEMVEMFNQNGISVTLLELVDLFFKGQKIRKENIMSLFLDFEGFVNFSLVHGDDFRAFMRKVRRAKKEANQDQYLPMNFDLVLEYFNKKGIEREKERKILKVIDNMNKVIKTKPKIDDSQFSEINIKEAIKLFGELFYLEDYKPKETTVKPPMNKALKKALSLSISKKLEAQKRLENKLKEKSSPDDRSIDHESNMANKVGYVKYSRDTQTINDKRRNKCHSDLLNSVSTLSRSIEKKSSVLPKISTSTSRLGSLGGSPRSVSKMIQAMGYSTKSYRLKKNKDYVPVGIL